jgi:hypothetical protein
MNLSGGGKAKNVVSIWNGDTGAVITAAMGTKTKSAETDASGYAFLTNLDAGTWTLQATKTGRYVGPKTITISSTQTVYYIKYPFRTYAYNGELHSAGEHGNNVCEDFSGGWYMNNGTYEETYIRAYHASEMQYIRNKTPIDLTPFTTFYIDCTSESYSGTNVGITSDSAGTTWRVRTTTPNTSRNTLSLDVSNFENLTGYIYFGLEYRGLRIYSAWFE